MQKTFIGIGLLLLVIGLLWPWLGKLPLGRLPGDIYINRNNVKIFIPFTTLLIVSLLLSLILWLIRHK